MSPFTEARMHLAVEIGGAGRHPAAARWSGIAPAMLRDPAHTVALVRDAAARGMDLVTLAATDPASGGPDAVELAVRIAELVPGIGLVPQVTAGPGVVPAAITALDVASAGQAGWEPVLVRSGGAVVDIGTVAPQQERPLTVIRAGRIRADEIWADDPGALQLAARWADVVRISAPALDVARETRDRVRAAVAAGGRSPEQVPVLLDVEVHLAASRAAAERELRDLDALAGQELPASSLRVLGGAVAVADIVERVVRLRAADGITFVPLALPGDLRAITRDVVPILAGRGLFRSGRPGTLRSRFVPARRVREVS